MVSSNLNKNNPMQPLLLINASLSTPLTTENMQVSGTMNTQFREDMGRQFF